VVRPGLLQLLALGLWVVGASVAIHGTLARVDAATSTPATLEQLSMLDDLNAYRRLFDAPPLRIDSTLTLMIEEHMAGRLGLVDMLTRQSGMCETGDWATVAAPNNETLLQALTQNRTGYAQSMVRGALISTVGVAVQPEVPAGRVYRIIVCQPSS
jgi:hypothetical protein